MKISLQWLNDYVDVQDYLKNADALADILTLKGLEVEGVENFAKQFQNVVVGQILEKGQHPNADKLTLCQVTTGEGRVHQIVCGAKNHKQGDRIVVALPGAILPGNFAIKLSKIRNVESQGMLCSERELGLSEESEGILILPEDAPIGKPFAEYKGLDDVIFELKVTPNRADCLSHYGLAREISCVLNRPLKTKFEIKFEKLHGSTKEKISVDVQNKEMCPRYTGRYIENVQIGPSPDWLKKRIESVGQKSINNIVDITNFVMLELGQPLHAFDADLIKGQKIIVSKARENEKFKTLDGTEISLTGTELMIRDGEKPVALAGVVGGLNSGIREETKNIFIESAFFTIETVRKTSRLHGIDTESGYRFSRGVDPAMTLTAMNRCCELVRDLAGGQLYGDHQDTNSDPVVIREIFLSPQDVSERLGFEAKKDDVLMWMKRLGARVEEVQEKFHVIPPSYRGDLLIKEDLIEEFARLHGYEHIPEKLPLTGMTPTGHTLSYILNQKVSQVMRSQGFNEAFNYAFVDEKGFLKFSGSTDSLKGVGLGLQSEPILIQNPLSEEFNILRQNLSYGLFKNVLHNVRQNQNLGRIFEAGYIFDKQNDSYRQTFSLGIANWGMPQGLWQKESSSERLFFETKTNIENFLKGLSIKSWSWEEASGVCFLHPGQSASLKAEGRTVGFVGVLHPIILDSEKLRVPVVMAEFNLDLLLKGQPRIPKIKSFVRTPCVERDIAFVMPEDLKVAQVITEIQRVGGPQVQSTWVFDVYQDDMLKKENKRSVAFRMRVQDAQKTLTDSELLEIDKKVVDAISHKFKISVR